MNMAGLYFLSPTYGPNVNGNNSPCIMIMGVKYELNTAGEAVMTAIRNEPGQRCYGISQTDTCKAFNPTNAEIFFV